MPRVALLLGLLLGSGRAAASDPCARFPTDRPFAHAVQELRARAELLANHVLETDSGRYEVLLPLPEGGFRIARAPTLAEAERLASGIAAPLDLAGRIESLAPESPRLQSLLESRLKDTPGVQVFSRTKELASLRHKLFDKVRERGPEFRLEQIDDIAGARVAVAAADTAGVDALAARIAALPELTVLKKDPKRYDRGYHAVHLTVLTPSGQVAEIQVMTQRMFAWVSWNARRVYKPRPGLSPEYRQKLRDYDQAIVAYLAAQEDHLRSAPFPPDPAKYGIDEADVFAFPGGAGP